MAFCFSAVENGECAGSLLGAMTPRECCVENGDSRSFVRPGEEDCITCIGKCVKTTDL